MSGLLKVLEGLKKDKNVKVDQDTVVSGESIVETISTGSIIVDKLLGKESNVGGLGRGRITEIMGMESSGKTTLALHVAKEVQKNGGNVAFVDFEAALDRDYARKATGIDTSDERFAHLQPQTLEEGCNIVDYLLENYKESKIDCVIIDSVKAMTPRVVLEGLMGDEPPMALQARLIGRWLTKLIKTIKNTGTSVILLNQMTRNIKSSPFSPGGDFETPGGLSIRFYASARIELKAVTKETTLAINPITNTEEEMPDSLKVRASIIKNKIGTPYRKAEFYIKYGGGIDNKRSIIDMAISHNIINQGGAWFTYKEDAGGFKLQGIDNVRKHLCDPMNKGLLKEITDRLIFQQDPELKSEGKRLEEEEKKEERKLAKEYKKAIKKE